jgi:hypothetical protein
MRKALIVLIVTCFACTEELEVVPYDYPTIFTGTEKKGWTIRNYQYLEEGKATQTAFLPDCLEDDLYIFFAGTERRFEMRDNDDKCNDEDPDLITEGNWAFSNTGASLTIPFPLLFDGPLPFVVRNAEEDEMTLEIFFNDNKSSYRFNFRVADLE